MNKLFKLILLLPLLLLFPSCSSPDEVQEGQFQASVIAGFPLPDYTEQVEIQLFQKQDTVVALEIHEGTIEIYEMKEDANS